MNRMFGTAVIALYVVVVMAGSVPAKASQPSHGFIPIQTVVSAEDGPISPEVSWLYGIIRAAGLRIPNQMHIHLTDGPENCGSAKSPGHIGGACTLGSVNDRWLDIDVYFSPINIGTEVGKHEILHEMAHVNGIKDECQAEYFAHAHGSKPNLWGYPYCANKQH